MSMRVTISETAICTTDGHIVRALYRNAEKPTTVTTETSRSTELFQR